MQNESLTNEALKKHFRDNFELAQFLIQVARHEVKAGRELIVSRLLKDVQKNPALYADEIDSEEEVDS